MYIVRERTKDLLVAPKHVVLIASSARLPDELPPRIFHLRLHVGAEAILGACGGSRGPQPELCQDISRHDHHLRALPKLAGSHIDVHLSAAPSPALQHVDHVLLPGVDGRVVRIHSAGVQRRREFIHASDLLPWSAFVLPAVQATFVYFLPRPHITEQVTSIAGMCVGWATGDAALKLLRELEQASIVADEDSAKSAVGGARNDSSGVDRVADTWPTKTLGTSTLSACSLHSPTVHGSRACHQCAASPDSKPPALSDRGGLLELLSQVALSLWA